MSARAWKYRRGTPALPLAYVGWLDEHSWFPRFELGRVPRRPTATRPGAAGFVKRIEWSQFERTQADARRRARRADRRARRARARALSWASCSSR